MDWLVRYMYTHLNPASATIPPTTRMFSLSSFRQSVGHYSSEECASKIHKQVHTLIRPFSIDVTYSLSVIDTSAKKVKTSVYKDGVPPKSNKV